MPKFCADWPIFCKVKLLRNGTDNQKFQILNVLLDSGITLKIWTCYKNLLQRTKLYKGNLLHIFLKF